MKNIGQSSLVKCKTFTYLEKTSTAVIVYDTKINQKSSYPKFSVRFVGNFFNFFHQPSQKFVKMQNIFTSEGGNGGKESQRKSLLILIVLK